jgi:hypothetical protein
MQDRHRLQRRMQREEVLVLRLRLLGVMSVGRELADIAIAMAVSAAVAERSGRGLKQDVTMAHGHARAHR